MSFALIGASGQPVVPQAIAWFEDLATGLTAARQDALRQYFCDPGNNAATFAAFEPTLRHLDGAQMLLQADAHLATPMMFGAMLCWGLSQPWGRQCATPALMDTWKNMTRVAMDQSNVKAAVLYTDFRIPLETAGRSQSSARRHQWRKKYYALVEALIPWDKFSSFKTLYTHPSTLALGQLVVTEQYTLRKRWTEQVGVAVSTMDDDEKRHWLATCVSSTLPHEQKNDAIRHIPAQLWVEDFVPLSVIAVLSPNEAKRCVDLPWSSSAALNLQLCTLYCPGVIQHLATIRASIDWTNPRQLLPHLEAMSSAPAPAILPVAIPADLFEMP